MKNRSEKNRLLPLLFVKQPHLKPPKPRMQGNFTFQEKQEPIKKHEESDELTELENGENEGDLVVKEMVGETITERNIKKTRLEKVDKLPQEIKIEKLYKLEKESTQENTENIEGLKFGTLNVDIEEKTTNEKQSSKITVLFHEKSLNEKVKHLIRIPASVVKIRYEFITTGEKYIGYFLSEKEGILLILNTRVDRIQSISLESLIDIKMIGI